MIASIAFRKFKALRQTSVELKPFNLVIGPNGSGKTSLIEAMLRLRSLASLPLGTGPAEVGAEGPEIEFHFAAPHEAITARLGCESDLVCNVLRIEPEQAPGWPELRRELASIRSYVLDHEAMTTGSARSEGRELAPDGSNLAAVLAELRDGTPEAFQALSAEMLRILPEFQGLELAAQPDGRVGFSLRLAEGEVIPAEELSQGTLYLIAVLALTFNPEPPRVLCIEEVDRGIHPRMLREIRDALYRLSHPGDGKDASEGVQIVATTHSPYFIDLFRDHPEEVVISQKVGRAARFERLSDRPDLPELLQEGSLGDMWFSGILGGIPEDR
ncbi:MAG: AAA family ATPase [Verrucomicrobia bacterium]|nr:AAA family ATPase [Verrucomicrobiota bacterium]